MNVEQNNRQALSDRIVDRWLIYPSYCMMTVPNYSLADMTGEHLALRKVGHRAQPG